MTAIKICGIKNRDDFQHAESLSVEYVGFVFAPSKRQVTAEQVAAFTAGNTRQSKLVGVFVDESPEEMIRIARVACLDVLQLHGAETPATCQALRQQGFTVWKAWGVCQDERDATLADYRGAVDAVLLDNARGGTGEKFSWDAIETIHSHVPDIPLFIAGGLHPENVGDLLRQHQAFGVDVSSGVETNGAKDPTKITAFVTRVREIK